MKVSSMVRHDLAIIFLLCVDFGLSVSGILIKEKVKNSEKDNIQLDKNDPPVVVSEELMYKSGTDERYRAAEKAISGGGGEQKSKDEVLKDTYDFNTFYNPAKWTAMLDDADYQEMEQDMKDIKAARWAVKKTQAQLDLEDDDDEENNNGAENSELDDISDDYEGKIVPPVEIELDTSAASEADLETLESANSQSINSDNEAKQNVDTADRVVAWMDAVGGDPEFELTEEGAKKKQDLGAFQFFEVLLPGKSEQEETVSAGDDKDAETLEDGEAQTRKREKRSSDGDDDYFAERSDEQKHDKERESGSDVTFDEDDYSHAEQDISKTQLDDDDDYSEQQARQEIDREYDDTAPTKSKAPYREKSKKEDSNRETDQRSEETILDSTRVKNDLNKADGTRTSHVEKVRQKVRKTIRNQDTDNDGEYRAIKSKFDEPDDSDDPKNGRDQSQIEQFNMPDRRTSETARRRNGKTSGNERETISADNDDDDEDGGYESVYQEKRVRVGRVPAARHLKPVRRGMSRLKEETTHVGHRSRNRGSDSKKNRIIEDADVDSVSRQEFEEFDRKHTEPHRRTQNLPVSKRGHYRRTMDKQFAAHLVPKDRHLAKAAHQLKNRIAFDGDTQMDDDDYQFDEDGTIEYARGQVCKFVAQQLPSYGFTGVVQSDSKTECDAQCQRSDGKQATVYHTFHLKNWPCGANLKGRCSNDGKCDSTSV